MRNHTSSDEIEAIYYVFVWVIMEYNGPFGRRVPRKERNATVLALDSPDPKVCRDAKTSLLWEAMVGGEGGPKASPYFDHEPIRSLFKTFTTIINNACITKDTAKGVSAKSKAQLYADVLECFQNAINEITEPLLQVEDSQAASEAEHTDVEEEVPARTKIPMQMVKKAATESTKAAPNPLQREGSSESENPFLEKEQDEEAAAEAPAGCSAGPRAQAFDGKKKPVKKPQPKKAAAVMKSPGRMRPKLNLNKRVQAGLGVRDQEEPEERKTGEKRKKQPVVYTGELQRSKRLKTKEADKET